MHFGPLHKHITAILQILASLHCATPLLLVQKVALFCTLVNTRTTRNYTKIQYDAVHNHIVILHCTVKTNNGCKKICILISDPILHKHVTKPIIYIFTLQKQTGGKGGVQDCCQPLLIQKQNCVMKVDL